MRVSASIKACCQGQRAGRCSVQRRAVRVRRPGREQSAAHGARGADGVARQAEHRGPAQQVVRERGDDRPGGVGHELAGREVREGLVFEVADRELDDGVPAVLGFDHGERFGAVGEEREQLPTRQQLALAIERADATNDEAPFVEECFGDLRDARWRVVLERRPGVLVDGVDRYAHGRMQAHADRELPARAVEPVKRRL
jgi:hypothetical protein